MGNTSYNALQAKLEKRFSHGLSFLVILLPFLAVPIARATFPREHDGLS